MRDSLKEWCETADFCIEEINRRAVQNSEAGGFPTMAYISMDLYKKLMDSYATRSRGTALPSTSHSVLSIMTTIGALNVQPVMRLKNFLFIGRKEEFDALVNIGIDRTYWNDVERQRVDKAFEDIVMEDNKNES